MSDNGADDQAIAPAIPPPSDRQLLSDCVEQTDRLATIVESLIRQQAGTAADVSRNRDYVLKLAEQQRRYVDDEDARTRRRVDTLSRELGATTRQLDQIGHGLIHFLKMPWYVRFGWMLFGVSWLRLFALPGDTGVSSAGETAGPTDGPPAAAEQQRTRVDAAGTIVAGAADAAGKTSVPK